MLQKSEGFNRKDKLLTEKEQQFLKLQKYIEQEEKKTGDQEKLAENNKVFFIF